jgi:hypothetical protein
MKLKERLVAATIGFGLAIALVIVLESAELLKHSQDNLGGDGGPSPHHGVLGPPSSSRAELAFKQRNLQKTDSSGNSKQVNTMEDQNHVDWTVVNKAEKVGGQQHILCTLAALLRRFQLTTFSHK